MKRIGKIILAGLILCSFIPPDKQIKVWLIGDSTIADKEIKAYPETGWGMPFRYFFDSTVVVENMAKNGRSTKSFIAEGLWQSVVDQIKEGDYVLIQFGHNDEVKTKVGRYTTPDEFKANLIKYISDARSKKGIPVLITPVARRSFDANGKVEESHPVYSDLVREVSKTSKAPLIDLDQKSMELLQEFGPDHSKWLYDYLEPDEHPNYPEGRKDDTHFSEFGARKMAEIVLSEIKNMHLGLADHIKGPFIARKKN
ncbi:MAG TPA: rhamnogalacturonan acetylesterase [Flavisolibacter sp.]|nr:rhamnogalacturonan acetylesterase [Flavisolibacter sp.]